MKTNVTKKPVPVFTHEGGRGFAGDAMAQLERAVLSCLLWEKQFYEDGVEIADRIKALVGVLANDGRLFAVADLASRARNEHHLRHVPLLLVCAMAEAEIPGGRLHQAHHGTLVRCATENCINRADELSELVALWWRNGKRPIPAAMKRGLAAAFTKFNAYQLAKYNRDAAVKLRDVMFLVHPKPRDAEQASAFKALADKTLSPPDTWEVALSGGADKKETFERLIREGRLGYLALLRNLRNMAQAGCDPDLVQEAIRARSGADRVLPFRYVAAARAAPQWEAAIDEALCAAVLGLPVLSGTTAVLVDVSGSMDAQLSSKSDMTRMDAAAALASVLNCESLRVFTFSNGIVEVPPRRGMAGVDAVVRSQPYGGTYLGAAVEHLNKTLPSLDRLIVITDEQSADDVPAPAATKAYMIDVASCRNGISAGRWTKISGFSEGVIRYIVASENSAD